MIWMRLRLNLTHISTALTLLNKKYSQNHNYLLFITSNVECYI
jgi:hypothetical protein